MTDPLAIAAGVIVGATLYDLAKPVAVALWRRARRTPAPTIRVTIADANAQDTDALADRLTARIDANLRREADRVRRASGEARL